MKIRQVGAEMFHADEWTERRTERQRSQQSLFAILRTRIKTDLSRTRRLRRQYGGEIQQELIHQSRGDISPGGVQF